MAKETSRARNALYHGRGHKSSHVAEPKDKQEWKGGAQGRIEVRGVGVVVVFFYQNSHQIRRVWMTRSCQHFGNNNTRLSRGWAGLPYGETTWTLWAANCLLFQLLDSLFGYLFVWGLSTLTWFGKKQR